MTECRSLLILLVLILAGPLQQARFAPIASAAAETPMNELAAQIRSRESPVKNRSTPHATSSDPGLITRSGFSPVKTRRTGSVVIPISRRRSSEFDSGFGASNGTT